MPTGGAGADHPLVRRQSTIGFVLSQLTSGRDGEEIRPWWVGADGPHPVLVEYDGYSAGSDPDIGRDWLAEGYAIVGVNVPGTGCSTGVNHIVDETVGAAGAAAVE
ncbi:CocE/NonD family hydrolase [Nocardia otitidiscaviarum]|uniref:CocE/NonD family hydrolase n=1 Tax=Nocardia otitidiscaviarum TaxID=1823 RepID=UPI0018944DAC|nr:CocE/NonD family hydrolase [Nocardia otitidiscaviarum]MBF6241148.1 hypothetical protein [Nocardia otitidiscaviarum]